MLNDIVTRALSHLTGAPSRENNSKKRFRYAYASDDGKYVAILYADRTTYVVDLTQKRYCAEGAGEPCGFSGHILEMAHGAAVETRLNDGFTAFFDLDMDHDKLDWKACPGHITH
jgi:hypothetical protein